MTQYHSALVVTHVSFEDLGILKPILCARRFNIQTVNAAHDDLSTLSGIEPDLLIILGGPISANDEADYPFLELEMDWIKDRLALKKPTLGICLGAQLIAKALGAKIYPTPEKEIGWYPITTLNTNVYPFFEYLNSNAGQQFHFHGETFDLPENTTHCASSQITPNQAFCIENHILALQFHPEVTTEMLNEFWVGHHHEVAHTDSVSLNQLREDSEKYTLESVQAATQFFNGWLDTLNLDNTSNDLHEYRMQMLLDYTDKQSHAVPYGCAIYDSEGNPLVNVLGNALSPINHAEIEAIKACAKAYPDVDWSQLTLYTTGEPCTMCASACCWANVGTVVYACSIQFMLTLWPVESPVRAIDVMKTHPKTPTLIGGVCEENANKMFTSKQEAFLEFHKEHRKSWGD